MKYVLPPCGDWHKSAPFGHIPVHWYTTAVKQIMDAFVIVTQHNNLASYKNYCCSLKLISLKTLHFVSIQSLNMCSLEFIS